jgi:hypothetical protein
MAAEFCRASWAGLSASEAQRHVDDLEEIAGFVQHGDGAVSAGVNS